ncbi:hypothetical protein N7495_007724 [Penicillium taxi]|uniref:uncharacterized protein n=1 Tax=Penicillium taxi TaxID=168475 RepID=UPI0025458914|nr:uncharacterized protein N7495_007724 [Penicillium taxi]KAJ5887683.1 hypothetical protein N7495_007724 [Penicillium taxi]
MDRATTSSQRIVKPSVKKRRPPLACLQCYQRKLKCGREFPSCSRCAKTGNIDRCTYRGNLTVSSSLNGMLSDDNSASTGAITTSLRTPVSLPETPERHPAFSHRDAKMTHLKGQEATTKFYGYSYPLNFYQQFTELPSYIVKIKTKNPAINTLRDEIYPLANDEYRLRPLAHDSLFEDTLRQLIPIKPVADLLVQTYIDRFEIIHRVLNISAFMADYNHHWVSPLYTPASFLVKFLLVAATAVSFHPEINIDVMSQQTVHDLTLDWLKAAESWLNSSASQPPQSWDTLATHCLLLIAKRANYIQESSFWTYTGSLVRWAMAAGYHREPDSTARISPYYRELRRRLWMTIVELDIQASIERGMPPSVRTEDFNIMSPLNIDDANLQELGEDPLKGMPLTTLTNTSFQALLYHSLTVRLKICAFVNGSREKSEKSDFDRVLQLEEELEEAFRVIPEWRNLQDNPRQQQTIILQSKTLLHSNLQSADVQG